MTPASIDRSFAHSWTAEILPSRPMILPSRHYVYPAIAEEVEKGALEILVRPAASNVSGQPFLATCALGFRDPAAPTGVCSTPHLDWLCAISGGYAYLIDTTLPERFSMIRYRPVLEVLPYSPAKLGEDSVPLLLFAGHHSILAWGREGEVWESDRLSSEGITNLRIEGETLQGLGWDLRTDKDLPFALDLRTGHRI
jgi:hypothetical protein